MKINLGFQILGSVAAKLAANKIQGKKAERAFAQIHRYLIQPHGEMFRVQRFNSWEESRFFVYREVGADQWHGDTTKMRANGGIGRLRDIETRGRSQQGSNRTGYLLREASCVSLTQGMPLTVSTGRHKKDGNKWSCLCWLQHPFYTFSPKHLRRNRVLKRTPIAFRLILIQVFDIWIFIYHSDFLFCLFMSLTMVVLTNSTISFFLWLSQIIKQGVKITKRKESVHGIEEQV